jgi:RNA polymerase sigma-70 factor (ECF subfamily)
MRDTAQQSGASVAAGDMSTANEALLAGIYREYSSPIHTYAFHLLGNQEDADDVTQEVFIRAYARLDQLRDPSSLRSWLYRIATNLCMDQMRRRSRIRRALGLAISLSPSDEDDFGPPHDVAQPMAQAELEGVAERDLISAALRKMPPKYATCLLLSGLQGLSYHEIADALGIKPGAAAVRLSRARDLFARHYDELRKEGSQ